MFNFEPGPSQNTIILIYYICTHPKEKDVFMFLATQNKYLKFQIDTDG